MENKDQRDVPQVQPIPQTTAAVLTPTPTNWSKNILFTVLGLVVVVVSVFVGIQIGKKQVSDQVLVTTQPTPTGSGKEVLPNTKSDDIDNIKNMCKKEQYQSLALGSLKRLNDKVSLIESKDLEDSDPLQRYLEKTKDLCKLLLSNNELQISEVDNDVWNYRFITKPFPDGISQSYGLIFFDNQYRFILPTSATL